MAPCNSCTPAAKCAQVDTPAPANAEDGVALSSALSQPSKSQGSMRALHPDKREGSAAALTNLLRPSETAGADENHGIPRHVTLGLQHATPHITWQQHSACWLLSHPAPFAVAFVHQVASDKVKTPLFRLGGALWLRPSRPTCLWHWRLAGWPARGASPHAAQPG